MRYALISAILAVISVTGLACERNEKSQIAIHNSISSEMMLNVISVVHNGKKAELKIHDYYNFDANKLVLNEICILYDENTKPWLLFNIVLNMHYGIGSSQVDLDEYQNGSWNHLVTIKNLTNGSMIESVNDFIKDKYGLEFK